MNDGLQQIGSNALNGCLSLATITIPSSVTSIGEDAFWYCGLKKVIIEKNYEDLNSSEPWGGTSGGTESITITWIDQEKSYPN